MLAEQSNNTTANWGLLANKITRMEMTLENEGRARQLASKLQADRRRIEQAIKDLQNTINRCTDIYKDIQDNLQEKQKVSLREYEDAIRESNEIVPDSDVQDCRLKIDGNRAFIVNSKEHDVNEREGSAERSTIGLLMRYTSLVKQPGDVIPMMLFDESFFTLSDNTSDNMRDYLIEFSEHTLIIAIEQKDTLFNGIEDKVVYNFTKNDNGKTVIRREEELT